MLGKPERPYFSTKGMGVQEAEDYVSITRATNYN